MSALDNLVRCSQPVRSSRLDYRRWAQERCAMVPSLSTGSADVRVQRGYDCPLLQRLECMLVRKRAFMRSEESTARARPQQRVGNRGQIHHAGVAVHSSHILPANRRGAPFFGAVSALIGLRWSPGIRPAEDGAALLLAVDSADVGYTEPDPPERYRLDGGLFEERTLGNPVPDARRPGGCGSGLLR